MFFTAVYPVVICILAENIAKHSLSKAYVWGCLALAIVTAVLVLAGRVYLGVHSIDQVVFGSLIGFSIF